MTPRQQAEYDAMVKAGESPAIAEILATQTCPGLQTDKRFMRGKKDTTFYSHQLQRHVGSRADVKKASAELNYDTHGSVTNKAYWDKPRDDEVPYEVADDIVDQAVFETLVDNPTALKDDPELIQKTREKLAGDL